MFQQVSVLQPEPCIAPYNRSSTQLQIWYGPLEFSVAWGRGCLCLQLAEEAETNGAATEHKGVATSQEVCGSIPDSGSVHVKVSLSKKLNLKLFLMAVPSAYVSVCKSSWWASSL